MPAKANWKILERRRKRKKIVSQDIDTAPLFVALFEVSAKRTFWILINLLSKYIFYFSIAEKSVRLLHHLTISIFEQCFILSTFNYWYELLVGFGLMGSRLAMLVSRSTTSACQGLLTWLSTCQPPLKGEVNTTSECVTDLDELNLVELCNGVLVLSSSQFSLLPELSQKMISLQSGQKWLKNNHLASLVYVCDTLCCTSWGAWQPGFWPGCQLGNPLAGFRQKTVTWTRHAASNLHSFFTVHT